MAHSPNIPENKQILARLGKLEARISQIESHLRLETAAGTAEQDDSRVPTRPVQTADTLELQIGEYWLARLGIIVLVVGIAFLLTLPYKNLPPVLPGLVGYILVAGMLMLSRVWQKSYDYLSRYLLGGGIVLLYFTTMRLHYFTDQPAIGSPSVELMLLVIVVAVGIAMAIRRESVYLSAIVITLGYVTALTSENPLILFILLTLMSALVVYLKTRYRWQNLVIYGIVLTYFAHFLWFLNNPLLGNSVQLADSPQYNLFFILLYALIFELANLFQKNTLTEDNTTIVASFLNCFGAYFLFLLITATKFSAALTAFHLLAFLVFMSLAVTFWLRAESKYLTFFQATVGFIALSSAIIARFESPDFFIWLCWQSLVVITFAIWFRSKYIIVANFIIYIILFVAYLGFGGQVGALSLSFGAVALLSARIMNWQKHHLELKTELMRNAYLLAAFVMLPFAFYYLLPGSYVSLSWIGLTIFYYLMSRILNNAKYRWMALVTILLVVLRVFVVDMVNLDPVFRAGSFLFLAIVLIVISVIYTRMRTRDDSGADSHSSDN